MLTENEIIDQKGENIFGSISRRIIKRYRRWILFLGKYVVRVSRV